MENFLVKLSDFGLLLLPTIALIDTDLVTADFTYHLLTIVAGDLRHYRRLLE